MNEPKGELYTSPIFKFSMLIPIEPIHRASLRMKERRKAIQLVPVGHHKRVVFILIAFDTLVILREVVRHC